MTDITVNALLKVARARVLGFKERIGVAWGGTERDGSGVVIDGRVGRADAGNAVRWRRPFVVAEFLVMFLWC